MLGLAVVVIAIWDLATARTGWVSPIILPSPMETLRDLIFVGENLLTGGYMLTALWTTTRTVFLGGGQGFGALIRQSASTMDTPRVFALILYLSLLGLALFFAVVSED